MSWFRPPFGMGWRELGHLLVLPGIWTVVSGVFYFFTLLAIDQWSALTAELALSAAQVFLGIAGFGAFILAVAGLGAQMRPPQAVLELEVREEASGRYLAIAISNVGTAAAEAVVVTISNCYATPDVIDPSAHWDVRWEKGWEYAECVYDRPLPPHGAKTVLPGMETDYHTITAHASNAKSVTWVRAERVEPHRRPPKWGVVS